MRPWKDRNFGKHPSDPEYDDRYDAEDDHERYMFEMELKYDLELLKEED